MHNRLLLARAVTTRLREIPGAVLALDRVRRRYSQGAPTTVVVNDFDGDLKMELELNGHMGSQIFWYGSYSRHILRVLDGLLRPGMTVVDVGANVGEITLFCAKRVGSGGRVLAFEPQPIVADRLERNVGLNALSQVEVSRFGLSDQAGEATLYTADQRFEDGTRHEGLSTIFPSVQRSRALQTIRLQTLDALFDAGTLERVDLIKIDVEGAELAVLRGARELLQATRPQLILEVQALTSKAASYEAADILRFLQDFGYRFYRIDRSRRPQPIGVGDLRGFQNVLARA